MFYVEIGKLCKKMIFLTLLLKYRDFWFGIASKRESRLIIILKGDNLHKMEAVSSPG